MASRMAKNHGIAQRANVTLEVVQEAGTSYVFFWCFLKGNRKLGNQKNRGAVVLVRKDSWIYQRYKLTFLEVPKGFEIKLENLIPLIFKWYMFHSLSFCTSKICLQKWASMGLYSWRNGLVYQMGPCGGLRGVWFLLNVWATETSVSVVSRS